MRNRKKNKILLLLILLLGISIGFAALSTTLKINGSAILNKNTWSIYWDDESIVVNPNGKSGTPTVTNGTDGSSKTKLTWSVSLDLPGDFYEFTIDAVNDGSIDAMVDTIDETLPTLPSYIKYSVTYASGVPVVRHQKFDKNSREKYKVRIEVLDTMTREDIANVPEGGIEYTFSYEVNYAQATSEAYEKATTFENDSWNVIKNNVEVYPEAYPVGSTKTIEMDLDGDDNPETYTLRVANNSRPDVCFGENFSQTACGFVVEFADIITTHRINSDDRAGTAGSSSTGSWNFSDMRAFVNSGVYAYENIDYTTSGIYYRLPLDLKNSIIPTKVLSGHNAIDTQNFETTDKLYLLSTVEVWGDTLPSGSTGYETLSTSQTRQLDYYRNNGVTLTDNCSYALKKNLRGENTNWWLRAPQAIGTWNYVYVSANNGGCWDRIPVRYSEGVSPAFRLS